MTKRRTRIKTAAPADPRLDTVTAAQRSLFPHYSNTTMPAPHSDFTGVIVFNITQGHLMICIGDHWKRVQLSSDF